MYFFFFFTLRYVKFKRTKRKLSLLNIHLNCYICIIVCTHTNWIASSTNSSSSSFLKNLSNLLHLDEGKNNLYFILN